GQDLGITGNQEDVVESQGFLADAQHGGGSQAGNFGSAALYASPPRALNADSPQRLQIGQNPPVHALAQLQVGWIDARQQLPAQFIGNALDALDQGQRILAQIGRASCRERVE